MNDQPAPTSQAKFLPSRRALVSIIAIVAAIVAAFIIVWLVGFFTKNRNLGIIPVPDYIASQRKADLAKLHEQGKDQQIAKAISPLTSDARNRSSQYEINFDEGVSYETKSATNNADDLKKALAAYQRAAQLNDNFYTSEAIGRVAERLGDKRLAIDSYQKAIGQLHDSSAFSVNQKSLLQNRIAALTT